MLKANADDYAQVDSLLAANRLPQLPSATALQLWVHREGARVIGAIGLECAETCGLLRSAVVSSSHRGRGVGRRLVQELIDEARVQELESVYLLTETAQPFFAGLGFEAIGRDLAPECIRQTEEFRGQCPDSAVLMHLVLR